MRFSVSFIFSLLFIISTGASPQLLAQSQGNLEITPLELQNMVETRSLTTQRAINIEGSPYLYTDFYTGQISLKNGHTTQPMPIRYNSHEQTIEFRYNNNLFTLTGDGVQSFEFKVDDRVYTFRQGYESRRLSEDDFVQVLAEGKITLLVRHHTSFFRDAISHGNATRQDYYDSSQTYFIKVGDSDPERLRNLRERRVMGYIDQHKDRVESFAKSNNIDFTDSADVAKLLNYYNSLFENK
jgi:hypothetical protein